MIKKILAVFIVVMIFITGEVLGEGDYDINASMSTALKAMGIEEFLSQGIDGSDVKIAIIDTGVDISHPDLHTTTQGLTKVIDFVDFTDEGHVDTSTSVTPKRGFVTIDEKSYGVEGIATKSGRFHVGVLKEKQLDEYSTIMQDLNRNGKSDDVFGVLVTDSVLPGIYDTVYVDTNLDHDFADEDPLKIYSKRPQWGNFGESGTNPGKNLGSSFVISHVDRSGVSVKIGFDGNGHGTHVAGIIGAYGRIRGVAPGAQILAIKALGSSGDGSWDHIAKAVEYAKSQGADIINISVGSMATSSKEYLAQIQLIKSISRDRDVLVVLAAGNNGPGLGTATDVGSSGDVLVVGAYASPDQWKINYGIDIPTDTILHDSGVGPNTNGDLAPNLIAPSMATSTVPLWDTGGYYMLDGTSMAAPFVSGAAALIKDRAKRDDIGATVSMVKRALEQGALSIEGYHFLEQGHGLLNMDGAWKALMGIRGEAIRENIAVQISGKSGYVKGNLLKGELPQNVKLWLTNLSNNLQDLMVESDAPWVTPEVSRLLLPRGKPLGIDLLYDFPTDPGLYTAHITGSPQVLEGSKLDFLTSAVVPHSIYREGNLKWMGALGPSRWQRYFFEVNPGIAQLDIALSILREGGLGRGILYVYDPMGRRVLEGHAGADYTLEKESVEQSIDNPIPGIWELVFVSDYNLSDFGVDRTHYELQVKALGPTIDGDTIIVSGTKGTAKSIHVVSMKNAGKDFVGQIRALGWANLDEPYKTSSIMVEDGEFAPGPSLIITPDVMELEVRLEMEKGRSLGDADIYLYRRDPQTQNFMEVASSTKNDVSEESIRLIRPLPGEYHIYIDGFSLPQGAADFKVQWRTLLDRDHIKVLNPTSLHGAGELWKVDLDIKTPETGSRFRGYLAVIDEEGKEVSHIPMILTLDDEERISKGEF